VIAIADKPIPHLAIDDKSCDEVRIRIVVVDKVFQGREDLTSSLDAVEGLPAPKTALWMCLQGHGCDDREIVGAATETLPEISVLEFVRIDDISCR